MPYDKKIFSYQYVIATDFVRHLAYYRGLKSESDRQGIKSMFWSQTINAHIKQASLSWCKIFGSEGANDIHWKKTPIEDVAGAKERLLNKILKHNIDKKSLRVYHAEMCAFRDKFVAHHDVDAPPGIPNFDKALQIAYIYDEWIRELIRPDFIDDLLLEKLYLRWNKVAESIGRLSITNNELGLGI